MSIKVEVYDGDVANSTKLNKKRLFDLAE